MNGSDPLINNTPLLDAIAFNATEGAFRLIRENPEDLNKARIQNTPLLLAVKKGNSTVACALLNEDGIDLDVTDGYGYIAIHYASLLRMNEVVELLLDKGASTDYSRVVTPVFESDVEDGTMEDTQVRERKPGHFYRNQFSRQEIADFTTYYSKIKYNTIYGFLDFHIADILYNQGWMTDDIVERIEAAQATPHRWTQFVFRVAYDACIDRFCEQRNLIPIDEATLAKLNDDSVKAIPAKTMLESSSIALDESVFDSLPGDAAGGDDDAIKVCTQAETNLVAHRA